MKWDLDETICAIATATNGAFRGVVRVSGPKALELFDPQFGVLRVDRDEFAKLKSLPRRIAGSIELAPPLGSVPCHYWIWPTHRSYTGQPSIEIHTLGNRPILDATIRELCKVGARQAEPGEFTMRAFMAGRLNLSQCEAVLGIIHAQSQRTLEIALKQLSGGLVLPVQSLRKLLIELLADIEAGLDFVDEDIQFIEREEILRRLDFAAQEMEQLMSRLSRRGGEGVRTKIVFAGLPNAGKSSLINALVGEHVSIVSATPGTTRDYIETQLILSAGSADLVDTAGIESIDADSPRGLAQRSTTEAFDMASLILYCIDSQTLTDDLGLEVILPDEFNSVESWVVLTKCDLSDRKAHSGSNATQLRRDSISVSIHDPNSIEALRSRIDEWLANRNLEESGMTAMTAGRMLSSLMRCRTAVLAAIQECAENGGLEIVASEIRIALDELGIIAGEVSTNDMLDALFSRFCIGK